jgi:abelson tyrosine-protein kinase 1
VRLERSMAQQSPQQEEERKGHGLSVDPSGTASSARTSSSEFITTGIDALRRLSKGADLDLPRWTITRYEIDLEAKVGVGFLATRTAERGASKRSQSRCSPRRHRARSFCAKSRHGSLYHPNVLERFGASSTSGESPWFLVRSFS